MSGRFAEQLQYLPEYLSSHLLICVSAMAIGIAVCLPLATIVTRVRFLQWPTLTFASVMQTIPGIALLALMVPLLGMIGFVPALVALVLYSMLPIIRNTVTGILETDPALVEAAQGIGMTSSQRLFKVELPLAMPVIIAGIRTSMVWVVGTATLSTPVGATSLGNYIFPGLQTQNTVAVVIGSVAAAVLAIVLDQVIRLIEIAAARRSRPLVILAGSILLVLIFLGLSPKLVASAAHSADPDQTIVLGAKQFTEQYVLAEATTILLEKNGFSVENKGSLGSSVLFEALVAGNIDCYMDYSGTLWANVLGRQDNPPADIVIDEVTRVLKEEFNVTCLGALGFENAYALAMRRGQADTLAVESIHDLSRVTSRGGGNLVFGTDYDFLSRPEWSSVQKTYDLSFRQSRQFDPTLMYRAIQSGQVDVITAYSTDGRIIAFDLMLLDDPLNALPPYDAVVLLSARATENRKLRAVLGRLLGSIDDRTMRQANKMVDLDGQSIQQAAEFLLGQSPGKE